jgi:hypothetical protein
MGVPLVVATESLRAYNRCEGLMFGGCDEQFGRIDRGLAPEERLGDFAFHPIL